MSASAGTGAILLPAAMRGLWTFVLGYLRSEYRSSGRFVIVFERVGVPPAGSLTLYARRCR